MINKKAIADFVEALKVYEERRYGEDADMTHEDGFDYAERLYRIAKILLNEYCDER